MAADVARAEPPPPGGGLGDGRTVFLSYNRENAREARQLRDWLRDEGLDVFMDNVHLVAGERWLDRLKHEIAQARAVIVLMRREGPRGFVLDEIAWVLERWRGARAQQTAAPGIFPVCLGAVPDEQTLEPRVRDLLQFQVTTWQPGEPMPVALLAGLRSLLPVEHFAPQRCPFRGLETFDESDANWFFGRLREIHEVIDALGSAPGPDGTVDRDAPGHHRLVVISGDSGSGKSSLMRAGVLPRLRRDALWPRTGLGHWHVAGPMRPGRRPLLELARALAIVPAPADAPPVPPVPTWDDPGSLATWLAERCSAGTGVLLLVDQLEELLQTGTDDTERRQFGAALAAALSAPSGPLYLLATVRADAMATLDPLLPPLVQARNRAGIVYSLPRITDSGLRLSIEEPARRAGIDVSEVSEPILAEARDEPGALALVQHAMWSLWQTAHRRGPVTRLLRSDHDAAGGLAGMLSRDADAALAEARAQLGSDDGAMRLLLRLTWVGAGDRLFRRRLARAEAELEAGASDRARGAQVIALLASTRDAGDARDDAAATRLPLLVAGQDGEDEPWIELVHELLLRAREQEGGPPVPNWRRLHDHVRAHLEELKLAQRLQADVQSWRRLGRWQRWRRLASLKEQRQYARLPRPADAATRRYLALSRMKSASLVSGAALPLAYLGVGSYHVFLQRDIFPINYALRVPLWLAGVGAEPEFVRLPGDEAVFDFGCDPARDSVGGLGCGPGLLPLQRGFTRPIRCDFSRYEVSFEQFDRYVFSARRAGRAAPAYPAPAEKSRGDLPVMEVSRAEAQAYADWLSAQSGGRARYRLPLEWEWEHAARAGSTGPYPWGSGSPAGRAVHDDGVRAPAAQPVQFGPPNAFGLHNAVGNASEWVADDATATRAHYVWRGGSFNQGPALVRIAGRQSLETDLSGDLGTATNIGFRLCRERSP